MNSYSWYSVFDNIPGQNTDWPTFALNNYSAKRFDSLMSDVQELTDG